MFTKRLVNYVLKGKTFNANVSQTRGVDGLQIYQPFRSGGKKYEEIREAKWEQMSEWDKFIGGCRQLKYEFRLWGQELSHQFGPDSTYNSFDNKEIVKYWDFDQRNNNIISSVNNMTFENNDMNNWRTSCDSVYGEGYSTCEWKVSPTGRGLFTGYLDTRVPADGRQQRSGFAFLGCEKARRSFFREAHFDWHEFTHLLVRCRGDGRNWFIILNTSDDNIDFTWFDRFQYVLYTHGGPYWQWCKIPFSRFYWQHKGYAQETQYPLPREFVSQIGFLLADNNTGPFNLEIDYVGCMKDNDWTEESAYEHYFHKENQWRNPGTT